jgi:sulfatase modifying factor 1
MEVHSMSHTFAPLRVSLICLLSLGIAACNSDGQESNSTTDAGLAGDGLPSDAMAAPSCPECPAECPAEANIPEGFVCVPAGEFWMGSPEDQVPRDANSEERHLVRITHAFLMGIHEVSQSDWQGIVGNNPSFFSENGGGCELEPCEDRPVERVNWHEAVAYANARSEAEDLAPCYTLTGCDGELGAGCGEERRTCLAGYTCQGVERISACTGYRLPTEAEWEYSARGGLPDYRYGPIDDIAWYVGTARGRTRPVAGREANPWGLYDVYGNVAEWTADYFTQDYGFFGQPDEAIDDPDGGDFGQTRTVKGGSWQDGYEWCRAGFRTSNFPAKRADNLGFRLIRQLK